MPRYEVSRELNEPPEDFIRDVMTTALHATKTFIVLVGNQRVMTIGPDRDQSPARHAVLLERFLVEQSMIGDVS